MTITAEGSVANPVIAESSGNTDLDQASLACVLTWKYWPAKENGKAVPVSGSLHVAWKLPDLAFAEPRRDCFTFYGVPADYPSHAVSTAIKFDVVENAVTNVAVEKSSGNAVLDSYAVACVQSWRYAGTGRTGTPAPPTRRNSRTVIDWFPRPARMPGTPAHICLNWPGGSPRETSGVLLSFTIDTSGATKDISIQRPAGNSATDRMAIECVSKWRYTPIVINGRVAEVSSQAEVDWIIRY